MSRKTKITTLFVAVATAAVFTSSASGMARMDNGAYGNGGVAGEAALDTSNIPYLSQRRHHTRGPSGFAGLRHHAHCAGPQPDLRRDPVPPCTASASPARLPTQATPIVRDTADGATLQRGFTAEVSVASSSSVDWSEVATGFGFGLLLAALGAASLLMLRQRTLRTQ